MSKAQPDGVPLDDAYGLARHRDGRWEWATAPGALPMARYQHGAAFVNAIVRSDVRLPFGGTKRSGFGRELAEHGIHEFMNIKSVYIA